MAVDYSVECALPYQEDFEGLEDSFDLAFSSLARQFDETKKTYARVLLVDDITNASGPSYDLEGYAEASLGSADSNAVVFRESMLNELADTTFAKLSDTMSPVELVRLKSDKGYSSPFYIMLWSLIRLGYLTHMNFPQEKIASKITNILPEEFRQGEDESLAILRRTQYPQAAQQIEYIYL